MTSDELAMLEQIQERNEKEILRLREDLAGRDRRIRELEAEGRLLWLVNGRLMMAAGIYDASIRDAVHADVAPDDARAKEGNEEIMKAKELLKQLVPLVPA